MPLNMLPAMNDQTEAVFANRDGGWLVIGGRLKPGVSVAAAAGEVAALGQALAREYPATPVTKGLLLLPSSLVPGNTGSGRGLRRVVDGDGVLRAPRRVRQRLRHSARARGRPAAGDRGAVVAWRRPRAAHPPAPHRNDAPLCDRRRRRIRAGARADLAAPHLAVGAAVPRRAVADTRQSRDGVHDRDVTPGGAGVRPCAGAADVRRSPRRRAERRGAGVLQSIEAPARVRRRRRWRSA